MGAGFVNVDIKPNEINKSFKELENLYFEYGLQLEYGPISKGNGMEYLNAAIDLNFYFKPDRVVRFEVQNNVGIVLNGQEIVGTSSIKSEIYLERTTAQMEILDSFASYLRLRNAIKDKLLGKDVFVIYLE